MSERFPDIFNKIKVCRGTNAQIDEIGRECLRMGSKNELHIAKMLEDMMEYYPLNLKLSILEIMTYILFNDKSKNYYRHLSPRIYAFFEKFKVEITNEEKAIKILTNIFQKWRNNNIFTDQFYNKLWNTCGIVATQKMTNYFQERNFVNYTKEQVQNIREVNKDKTTKQLYHIQCRSQMIKRQIKKIASKVCNSQQGELSTYTHQQIYELRQKIDQLTQQQALHLRGIQDIISNQLITSFENQSHSIEITSMQQLIQ